MPCINSIEAELYAHEQDIADELEEEWKVKLDSQIHDLIHKERLTGVVLHLFENCLLEEPLVQCYLAKTQEEKLVAYENLMEAIDASLVKVATKRQS